jgi:bacteriorhodopsin
METLTSGQYDLVSNLMSLTVAAMGAAALFFFLSRSQVAPKLRPALTISGVVVAIACYHYFRIYESFAGAYSFAEGVYQPTGKPFNDAYRYADWLLTVPLLVVELVAVLALAKPLARSLTVRLATAALLMIALGYPGEVSADTTTRWVFWGAAMVPWAYIMYVLFGQFGEAIQRQPENVRGLVGNARALILITWAFYPVAYLGPELGLDGASAHTFVQVGYTIADISAKVGLGIYIYFIARGKSDAEGYNVGSGSGDGAVGDSKQLRTAA